MLKKWGSLVGLVLIFQLIGYFLGQITAADLNDWYVNLNKAALNPPNFVFPLVWTILYIILAFVGWYLWQEQNKSTSGLALLFFTIQMLMNWAWTPLFFHFHLIGLSFFWLLGIVFFTFLTIIRCKANHKICFYLLIPYLLWLLFASYLNGAIWFNN